jgi:hypothetical protein
VSKNYGSVLTQVVRSRRYQPFGIGFNMYSMKIPKNASSVHNRALPLLHRPFVASAAHIISSTTTAPMSV